MYKKLNYAIGDVASTTAIDATTLTLKAGHTITTDIGETNKFVAVFYDGTKSSPYQDTNREIVEAYRTNTNDFVIARAKEGTSAKEWVENDKFMLIASAGVFNEYETEIASKQDALGFTPENVVNKKTTLTDSDVDYPTCKAVNTGLSAKQNTLGFTPENVANKRSTFQAIPTDTAYISEKLAKDSLDAKENLANKKTTLTDNSDTYYPTQKAVKTALDAKQDTLTFGIANTNAVRVDDASVADNDYAKFTANGIEGVPYSTVLSDIGAQAALGYTAENSANKVTSFQATPDNTHYASEKLIKDSLDEKVNLDQTTPQTITDGSPLFSEGVDMANDKWLKSKDYAGTEDVNIIKVNTDNEAEIGVTMNTGTIEVEEDAGAVTIIDMGVTSASADGTEMSYVVKIDGNNLLKIYAESDGAGGVDTFKVQLLNKAVLTMEDSAGTTHTYTSDTDGSLIIS